MKKAIPSMLLAAMLATSGLAMAQSSTIPTNQGDASTRMGGATDTVPRVGQNTRADVKEETRAARNMGNNGTVPVSGGDGDVKQMKPTDGKTRAEKRAERDMKKADKKAARANRNMDSMNPSSNAPAGTPPQPMGTPN